MGRGRVITARADDVSGLLNTQTTSEVYLMFGSAYAMVHAATLRQETEVNSAI